MRVLKFGGASVKNAEAIKKAAAIIRSFPDQPLLVVVSAMGKTTNALERLTGLTGQAREKGLDEIMGYHMQAVEALFGHGHALMVELASVRAHLEGLLGHPPSNADEWYDQVVSQGEIMATRVVASYLQKTGLPALWVDARKYIITDDSFREAKVDWGLTGEQVQSLRPLLDKNIVVTQGFIGSAKNGPVTTLGREGSDYSAAIFASCLQAMSVTIWKDVPGVMNADPKRLPTAVTFEELPFKEAAEMTYYGATVIHPKTIKPLANHNIPLYVKNFDDIHLPGTKIHECKVNGLPPLIIFKDDQCLVSCQVTDYTFINESQLGIIFNALSAHRLKVNLIQSSAISFSFCLDFKEAKVMALIAELGKTFEVYYNTGLTLVTIKNYDTESFNKYKGLKNIVLEQTSRSTLQVLTRS